MPGIVHILAIQRKKSPPTPGHTIGRGAGVVNAMRERHPGAVSTERETDMTGRLVKAFQMR